MGAWGDIAESYIVMRAADPTPTVLVPHINVASVEMRTAYTSILMPSILVAIVPMLGRT